jgi:membrane-associated phospholipid phosphatase
MPAGSSNSFARRLGTRVAAHWRFKAVLAGAIGTLFTAAYLLIGHFPVAPVRTLPLTAVDRAIGFHPYEWVWIYQSVYLPVNVIPWLADRREDLRRYVAGFVMVTLVSFAVFVVWPIRAPKPHVESPRGMYWLLQQYDAPYNSLPSLHAGLLVYTLAFGRRVVGHEVPGAVKMVCVAWGALILYGTLATKEHYAVDIVAGAALGLLADRWAWRGGTRGGRRVLQDTPEERADVPRRVEVVVGAAHGEQFARQVEQVAQQDAAAVVGAERR